MNFESEVVSTKRRDILGNTFLRFLSVIKSPNIHVKSSAMANCQEKSEEKLGKFTISRAVNYQ